MDKDNIGAYVERIKYRYLSTKRALDIIYANGDPNVYMAFGGDYKYINNSFMNSYLKIIDSLEYCFICSEDIKESNSLKELLDLEAFSNKGVFEYLSQNKIITFNNNPSDLLEKIFILNEKINCLLEINDEIMFFLIDWLENTLATICIKSKEKNIYFKHTLLNKITNLENVTLEEFKVYKNEYKIIEYQENIDMYKDEFYNLYNVDINNFISFTKEVFTLINRINKKLNIVKELKSSLDIINLFGIIYDINGIKHNISKYKTHAFFNEDYFLGKTLVKEEQQKVDILNFIDILSREHYSTISMKGIFEELSIEQMRDMKVTLKNLNGFIRTIEHSKNNNDYVTLIQQNGGHIKILNRDVLLNFFQDLEDNNDIRLSRYEELEKKMSSVKKEMINHRKKI